MRKTVSAVVVLLSLAGFANAQDISGQLEKAGSQYAKGYITPAADAFGVDLNSGLFNTAKVGGILPFGLSLYVGVKAGAAVIPASEQTFSMSYIDTVSFSRTVGSTVYNIKVPATFTVNNAPTIFGDKSAGGQASFTVHQDTTIGSQQFTLDSSAAIPTIPGLGKISIAALPVAQVGLGSIFGTDIFIRYLPKMKIGDYGSVELLGYGIRHSVSQYIPLVPVDIAVQLGWQNFSIFDADGNKVIKASAFAANVEVSKTLAMITLYGGLQVESSSMDVNYNFTPPATPAIPGPQSIPVAFTVKGKNNFRALIGLNVGLFPFSINADYDIGSINSISAGIGIAI